MYRQFGFASHPNSLCLAATLPTTGCAPSGRSSVALKSPRETSTSESEAVEEADEIEEKDEVVDDIVGMVSVEKTDELSPLDAGPSSYAGVATGLRWLRTLSSDVRADLPWSAEAPDAATTCDRGLSV